MNLLVVGTGALACLFAGKLVEAGQTVTMLGNWAQGVAALRLNGVILQDLEGVTHQYPVKVLDGGACQGDFDYALVLVKAWQTRQAAQQLKPCLSATGIALTLQNGYGNFETLEEILGEGKACLGVTSIGARMLQPGHVQHTGKGKISIGAHPSLNRLVDVLRNSGFQVEVVQDAASVLWGKLVINAAINPLTAILRVPNGELLTRQPAHQLLAQAAIEAAEVAEKKGIRLPYTDPVVAVEEVARNTALNTSSMLQDVLRGTPTEVDAINGMIVLEGEKLGVPTPVNRVLWQLVKSLYPNGGG